MNTNKMKKEIFLYLLLLTSFSSFAQEKTMLTKEETINYINKKLKECEGHFRTPDGSAFTGGVAKKMHYTSLSFNADGDRVSLSINSSNYSERKYTSDYFERYTTQQFNPSQILSITEGASDKSEPLGIIIIKFISNSCISKQNVYWYGSDGFGNHDGTKTFSVKESGLVFLSADPSNFNKIKKALEHLRDMYKAGDDPF